MRIDRSPLVILLNAPPGAGKDTIAKAICEIFPAFSIHMEMKAPMFRIAAALTGMSEEKFRQLYSIREKKENPCEEFLGYSGRELFIDISENVCKPRFGNQYFGKVAARTIKNHLDRVPDAQFVFSDSGFVDEMLPVAEVVGKENVVVVQFTGMGSNEFVSSSGAKDSRNFVDGTPYGIKTIKIKPNENVTPTEYALYLLDEVYHAIYQ